MQKETYLVTCALPYVNNEPHLGNVAGNILPGHAYAEWLKKCGHDVLLLCGTDEYGTATEVKAQKEGLTCEQVCDNFRPKHVKLYEWFGVNFDVFGKTTTEIQTEITHDIFLKLHDKGFLIPKICTQLYCGKCTRYVCDRFVNGKCYHTSCNGITTGDQCDICCKLIDVDKLKEKWCSICKSELKEVESKHLFFKIGEFSEQLTDYFLNGGIKYISPAAHTITKAWLSNELEDRSVTRDLKWGTPMVDREDLVEYKDKVFYVWFDAPIGYLSILKHGRPDDWQKWIQPNGNWIQFMAKDNVPFHSIIFPSTLLGSDFPMGVGVTHLAASEYLLFNDSKFSKSNNVGIFGNQVIELSKKLDIDADYWRYYLLKIRPENSDSNFTYEDFEVVIKGELVSKFGNLIQRVVKFKDRFYNNTETIVYNFNIDVKWYERLEEIKNAFTGYMNAYEKFNYHEVIRFVNKIAELGNLWMTREEPWVHCKIDPIANEHILGNVGFTVWILAELLSPIMPSKARTIKTHVRVNLDEGVCSTYENIYQKMDEPFGNIVINPTKYEPLFKHIDLTNYK
jgi:methionyl-tRNA synthetase